MIVRVKPKIDNQLKKLFDRLLSTSDKTLPLHFKFIKNMTPDLREQFMEYFSYSNNYDLKEYNLLKNKFKNNEKLFLDGILDIVMDFKDSEVWKNDHLKNVRGIYLGSMYQIRYRNYQHDPFPLAIFLNTYDAQHQNFQAINLHYFVPQFRKYFVEQIITLNKPRIIAGQEPILTLQMTNKLIPHLGIAFRNYKASEIKVVEKINPSRWQTYLEIDKRKVTF